MQVTRKSRLFIRLQNIAFVVLFLTFIGLLAWLSTRYTFVADWTQSSRNTLADASVAVLENLQEPVTITAFVRDTADSSAVRQRIKSIVERYQRHKPDLQLTFINPDIEPQMIRDLGISVEGELLIRYQGRSENLQNLTEQSLTNALQRVARDSQHWVIFVEGHGERSPQGRANHDVGDFVTQLTNKGLKARAINLATTKVIPDNTAVLVIASPQVPLLAGEVRMIDDYVDKGGNLLWLHDPGELHGLEPLAERLGVEFHPGVIVDATTQAFGITDPRFALVGEYGNHPITQGFNLLTLFPQASGIDSQPAEGWQADSLLLSSSQSWSETGDLQGSITLDQGSDVPGPLNISVVMTREKPGAIAAETDLDKPAPETPKSQQRVVVIGDGDFLSNAYLGNSGNMDLGLRIINWLSRDDNLISIPAKTARDRTLELGSGQVAVIGFGFLLALPLLLLATGIVIWMRRRKR